MNVKETPHFRLLLTIPLAQEIKDEAEREFAIRCLLVGCILWHQIPVGSSIIDFLVINPKRPQGNKPGTLVEITRMSKADSEKKTRVKEKDGKRRRIGNKTGRRKQRQIAAMKKSGHRWTILYGYRGHLEKIKKGV